MRPGILLLMSALALCAADEAQLALALRAQSDFERVRAAIPPQLPDTERCVQSEAAYLAVAVPAELALAHFRKGYCALAGATITRGAADFQAASAEFAKAIETWPQRISGKAALPEPVSSGLRILAQIAELEPSSGSGAWMRARHEFSAAADPPVCSAAIMSADLCQRLVRTAHVWLGWIALREDDRLRAARDLTGIPDDPWSHWAKGQQAFADRNYAEAASQYRQAVEVWTREQREPPADWLVRLDPQPVMAQVLTDLGGAQLLSRDFTAAVGSLDAAIRADPSLTRAIYFRGRAKEESGNSAEALADYNLAARTALAHASDVNSGEAHLYRGILLERRKDYASAEEEFTTALNAGLPDALREDASAWRHLAAVAAGSCASRPYLEQSLEHVSPYFPKEEARKLSAPCPL